jgi:hypothetical protein
MTKLTPTTFETPLGTLSLSEFLKQSHIMYGTGNNVWIETTKIIPEKELTEKQLFTKLKKELKEVSVKLN